MVLQKLHKLQQINNLVIAPITNERPGIIRFNGLPFKTVLGYPVRVVAIKGGSVQKFVHHAFHKTRIRMSQCFPILKNIPPVTLIIENFGSVLFTTGID